MTAVRTIPVRGGVKSLTWDGDDLVDLVGGGRRWAPDPDAVAVIDLPPHP